MSDVTHHDYPRRRRGILLGVAAVLCWASAGAAASSLGKRLGIWPYLTIACGIGGLAQLVGYRLMGRSVRSLLLPPAKLWLIILLGFPVYEFAHVAALSGSVNEAQTVGVNLINYLWPTLTVVFAVMWVPGSRWSGRLAVAVLVALAGLVVGNWKGIQAAFGAGDAAELPMLPYVLDFVAAVSWAVYSALLSRWRAWADRYSTATAGFLSVSLVAGVVCVARGDWPAMTAGVWCVVVLAGLVPFAAGYMLWELAIHRAPAEKLGILGGAAPILSTLCLYAMFALTQSPGRATSADILRQLLAAALVAAAVLISLLGARREIRNPKPQ